MSRPSTTRVKVILDLMEKLPNRIRLQFVDGRYGKLIEVFQEIVYDILPLYFNYCKHQGHVEDNCYLISKINQNNKQIDDTIEVASKGTIDGEKYQGDIPPPTLNSKLSPKTPVFVPKCVIAKKNESRALLSNTVDLGEDSLDEDKEDNMLDLGEDSLDGDEEDMLDICFDRVARERDISPRK
ncbi:hypothetical protein H5410_050236 [Solanum commersonii]|uniref:Uncharacterized protein n=1 Tax=Solanum commersonii TaxID=4109 RepID=A0A9J5WUW9_SOLCO|nr:hypothetical protein H5410_050236 [Solanum commersonii]